MALVYPTIETIKSFKVQPTEGEWKLLTCLAENFNDEYEVYFQPFLNEARPDVIVMRKGGGAVIFEVKDWDLSNYRSAPDGTWIVKANGERMSRTPIRQVVSYKEALYSLNSTELFRRHTIDGVKGCWGLVSCAVFFHGATKAEIDALCCPSDITPKNRNFLSHVKMFGDDNLTPQNLRSYFALAHVSKNSRYFDNAVYADLHRLFKPDIHTIEQGIEYKLSPVQTELSKSVVGGRKRIKGVAGAGKSFVLARRAVNAHKRTGGRVLILTYNITLKNYLHDRISEVRENFEWYYFEIENYHQHFNAMLDACSLSVRDVARSKWPKLFVGWGKDDGCDSEPRLSDAQLEEIYADATIFHGYEDLIRKYDVILIDEAQDYREEWVRILMKYVASEGAEVVAFADEKQNVYERALDEGKFPVIPIASGPWDKSLNRTYRLNTGIAELSMMYQRYYFEQKYVIDNELAPAKQLELMFDCAHIEYHFLSAKMKKNELCEQLAEYLQAVIRTHNLHANDMTVLSASVDLVRELSYAYAKATNEKVNCMCESHEEYLKMEGDELRIKDARKFMKQNFWQNTGSVSFSSIHSFKGLESPATMLILGDGELVAGEGEAESSIKLFPSPQELIYVGLTRTRNYLFVVNVGDVRYDAFFRSDAVRKYSATVVTAFPGSYLE